MKNLVVLSGAGMSAESGISTFRDAGGLWDKFRWNRWRLPKAMPVIRSWLSTFITSVASNCWMKAECRTHRACRVGKGLQCNGRYAEC